MLFKMIDIVLPPINIHMLNTSFGVTLNRAVDDSPPLTAFVIFLLKEYS